MPGAAPSVGGATAFRAPSLESGLGSLGLLQGWEKSVEGGGGWFEAGSWGWSSWVMSPSAYSKASVLQILRHVPLPSSKASSQISALTPLRRGARDGNCYPCVRWRPGDVGGTIISHTSEDK